MSFGAWLRTQVDRDDWIGTLAKAAAADPGFPRNGSPKELWKRLNEREADGEMLTAMEDAENAWESERDG